MTTTQGEDPRTKHLKPPYPEQTQPRPGSEARMEPAPDYASAPYGALGRLRDRVALITGADSGIGRAVAVAYAREGADVAVAYLNEHEDARQVKAEVESLGRKALLVDGDLADDKQCQRLIQRAVEQWGRIDILVNNAAEQAKAVSSFEQLTAERVERTFRVNILAMFNLIRHALPHMREGGSIINVASIQAYQPSPSILDYASTKGAIVTFTKGLSLDLIKRGIRVNCVAPGPVWTPIIPQSFPADKVKDFGKDSPMERPAQPSELAPAFVFLASQEATYINGEVLGVTGGRPLA